jgi:DNA-binding GntR family transcriptional regulator
VVERQTPLPPPKDMMINELNLTELETKTLTTFIGGLYAEPGFSDVDVNDLSSELGISTKVLRGALGSLVKKNIVSIDSNGSYDIIYLREEYWYLVNEDWAAESRF